MKFQYDRIKNPLDAFVYGCQGEKASKGGRRNSSCVSCNHKFRLLPSEGTGVQVIFLNVRASCLEMAALSG